jgi:cysteine-rich repeat protein
MRPLLLLAPLLSGCVLLSGFAFSPCGDQILQPGEECDDGNNRGGDGCEADCALPFAAGTAGVGDSPQAISAGDVDGDGDVDLATANEGSGDVSVLLNDGRGGFPEERRVAIALDAPKAVALVDLDGDGDVDLATANKSLTDGAAGSASIFLNDGAGGFALAATVALGIEPQSIAGADLDDDPARLPELVVANQDSNSVTVIGLAGGGFEAQLELGAGTNPQAALVADIDGDLLPDIVVTNKLATDNLNVLLNDAGGVAGQFALRAPASAGNEPQGMALADLDGRGAADIVTSNKLANNLSLLLNDGAGGLISQATLAAGESPQGVALEDLNGDGLPDIACANEDSDDISVLFNLGGAEFSPPISFAVGEEPESLVAADLNGDGKADLAVANQATSDLTLFLSR